MKPCLRIVFFRSTFKPNSHFIPNDDDPDDDYDDLIDDEDDTLDCEQMPDSSELEDIDRSTHLSVDQSSVSLSTSSVELDEYISDVETESNDSSLSISSLTSSESKEIFFLFDKTYLLLIRTRKLIKMMRNIAVIDTFIKSSSGGCTSGFVLDMQVNLFSCLLFTVTFLLDEKTLLRKASKNELEREI